MERQVGSLERAERVAQWCSDANNPQNRNRLDSRESRRNGSHRCRLDRHNHHGFSWANCPEHPKASLLVRSAVPIGRSARPSERPNRETHSPLTCVKRTLSNQALRRILKYVSLAAGRSGARKRRQSRALLYRVTRLADDSSPVFTARYAAAVRERFRCRARRETRVSIRN